MHVESKFSECVALLVVRLRRVCVSECVCMNNYDAAELLEPASGFRAQRDAVLYLCTFCDRRVRVAGRDVDTRLYLFRLCASVSLGECLGYIRMFVHLCVFFLL